MVINVVIYFVSWFSLQSLFGKRLACIQKVITVNNDHVTINSVIKLFGANFNLPLDNAITAGMTDEMNNLKKLRFFIDPAY